jgi:hypothetical protein
MKTRMILAFVAVFFAGFGLCLAGDPQMGTWKLNEAKSRLNPEAAKVTTAVYVPAGDSVKITVDGVDKDGTPVHDEWTGKFDGKDYPVTGDPRSDMRSYRKIDDHTLELTAKKSGKVVTGGFIVISADGTSRTTIAMMSDPSGNMVPFIAVYNKQ